MEAVNITGIVVQFFESAEQTRSSILNLKTAISKCRSISDYIKINHSENSPIALANRFKKASQQLLSTDFNRVTILGMPAHNLQSTQMLADKIQDFLNHAASEWNGVFPIGKTESEIEEICINNQERVANLFPALDQAYDVSFRKLGYINTPLRRKNDLPQPSAQRLQ